MDKKQINICIASPGDIILERKIVREVCLGMNDGLLPNEFEVSFNVTIWEYEFPTDRTPKEVLEGLTEKCDIFICIFHKKYYTSSQGDDKGALEKFLSSFDLWADLKKPQCIFFFKDVTVSALKDIQDPELIKLLELKENILNKSSHLCIDFSIPQTFCEKVHDQIQGAISKKLGIPSK